MTDVRTEQLRDISAHDAESEGIERSPGGPWRAYGPEGGCVYSAVESYRSLWEDLNGAGSWLLNPWVWVVSFEVAP